LKKVQKKAETGITGQCEVLFKTKVVMDNSKKGTFLPKVAGMFQTD
jgi:hypothetical protein